jgi:excisionase family DNA binding protein
MSEEMKLLAELAGEIRTLRGEVMDLRATINARKAQGDMLTMAEACEVLRVGRTKMTAMLQAGELPWAIKRGKEWRIPADKLRKYMCGQ